MIDSWTAVIRELVENSLDAGADRITISLLPELWRVQVADNGCGMSLADLRLCVQAHSTSKLSKREDLEKIQTLGFRGEALYSLAQLADLEISSRPSQEPSQGWRLVYRQGELVAETPAAIAPGTIITVSNLFSQQLLRREVLCSPLKGLQTMLGEIALCHPYLTLIVRLGDKPWLKINPGKNAAQILPQLIKRVPWQDLQWLKQPLPHHPDLEDLELVIGLPDRLSRPRPDWLKIAVNGRVVQSPELEQAVLSATARIFPRDRYPVAFLHLHLQPSQIDWHRHPSKAEIYLHDLSYYQEQIREAIATAFKLNPVTLDQEISNQRVKELLKVAEVKQTYNLNASTPSNISFHSLQAIGQVNRTYIVAQHPAGVWLIEQHIAHERVLYEQLQQEWQLIPLDTPLILPQLQEHQIQQLESLGIETEAFGEELWAIRTIPALLHNRADSQAAILELSLGGDREAALVATACRSAIRNGTELSLSQMQQLIQQWQQTRNPRTCPHGRPIYLALEESSLSRFFRRHWVIGKSHGI